MKQQHIYMPPEAELLCFDAADIIAASEDFGEWDEEM